MIARFCGPATVSTLETDESKVYQLPKTLNEAVMLTGDLFERLTLNLDIEDLKRPRVCLAGPPGTGKSKILALVGKKWISEGHTVHLINTCAERSDAITQLHKLLLQSSTGQSPDTPVKFVKTMFCNIKNLRGTEERIKRLISEEKENTFFSLIDEPDADKKKLTDLQGFLQKLNDRLPDLHLWLAICSSDMAPLAGRESHSASPSAAPLQSYVRHVKVIWGRNHVTVPLVDKRSSDSSHETFVFANQDTQNASENLQPESLQTSGRQSSKCSMERYLVFV
ncbi:uncharacterized protein LOC112576222 [Pomacea canaliculata]|uniref:uncharacterized protein LOC112576222 n=1 Tax=Pomacea canaliculata TaxID=400727 RepID=UPI000D73BD80|nr:uncharacterized protein LOC112576222 [Pomacea canaliculata]